jgi:hypothetical protein
MMEGLQVWYSPFSSYLPIKFSASARISKGQGYQGFLRKRAGSSIGKKGQFASYKEKLKKMDRISLLLGSIKCFPIRTEFHYF